MPNNSKPLDDEEIVSLIDTMLHDAVSFHDSELSVEREDVLRYYDGKTPRPNSRSNSRYVSQDVYDSTEQAVAAIGDVFIGDHSVGSFEPEGPEDVGATLQATRYCDYVVFRYNDGDDIFQTALRDGLMNRTAIGKVYWEEEDIYYEEDFKGLTADQLEVLLEDPEVEDVEELLEDEDTGLLEGTIVKKRIRKGVRIENVTPEEFGVSPRAKSLEASPIVFHRQQRTQSDLKKMLQAQGYKGEELEELMRLAKASAHDISETDPEREQRFEGIDETVAPFRGEGAQPASEKVWIYESYAQLDVEGSGRTKLWKVLSAGKVLIEKEPVEDYPFIWFTPVPRPHSFWGNNWAQKIIPTQNAKTTLTRGILDHTVSTNKPRYTVLKGTLRTNQELMDDRHGGMVNVNKPGGIEPLPQAPLNPFTFQTIQLLQTDLEDTTGVSSLMTGLNKDAISKQNSNDMVTQLTTLAHKRLKLMARNFANQWVKQLYLKVYKLAIKHDDQETILSINGDYIPVNPTTWKDREDFTIEIEVGYGEAERKFQQYVQLDQYLSGAAPGQYGPEQKFRVLSKALENIGIKDVANYIVPNPPPPQPDPFAVAEMQMKERELALREAELQMKAQEMALKGQLDQQKFEADLAERRGKYALASDAQDLKERQYEHAAEVADRELAVMESAQVETKGIASPN